MNCTATIRHNGTRTQLDVRGALSASDARAIACQHSGAMPWNVAIEESSDE